MKFPYARKLGNICCGHKMFLNKIRNIFCVPDTKFVSTTKVGHAGKRGNICVGNNASQQYVLVCQGLYYKDCSRWEILSKKINGRKALSFEKKGLCFNRVFVLLYWRLRLRKLTFSNDNAYISHFLPFIICHEAATNCLHREFYCSVCK